MISVFFVAWMFVGQDFQQPAFFVMNGANAANQKMISDEQVIAFAQTPQGRVLFSAHGAFVGIPENEKEIAVLQVGFSQEHHKQGIQPKMGAVGTTKIHHFQGAAKSWQKDMAAPGDLTYQKVWPGIDLQFLTKGSSLEFQLHLAPGAKAGDIVLTTGAKKLEVEQDALIATLGNANLRLSPPKAFQMINGIQIDVPVAYRLLPRGEFGFSLGAYDASWPLVIDPVLSWSSFFGGSGSAFDSDRAVVLAVNNANEAFVGGETASPDFPVTAGVFSTMIAGSREVFVGKLSADGTTWSFLTFIGSSNDDRIYDLALDASENIYITGETREGDFPTTPGAFDRTFIDDCAYVTKLNPTGSALVYSTFLGGNDDGEGREIFVEPGGSVLALIETSATNLPTTPGSPGPMASGSQDIYIARLSADGSQVLFGTYFGGSASESMDGAKLLADGRVIFSGDTNSNDIPATSGAFSESNSGGEDIFVAVLSADQTSFSHVTYIGGTDDETSVDIGFNPMGQFLVGGYTESNDFPTTVGAFDETFNGDRDGVVFKLSADLSTLIASTFLGTDDREFIRAMDTDSAGLAIALGTTRSGLFPTTPGALDESANGGNDIFVTKFNSDLSTLVFSTFLGGADSESLSGIALDASGNIFGAGSTRSLDIPFTIANRNGTVDAMVFKISADGSTLEYNHLFGGGTGDFAGEVIKTSSGENIFVGSAGARSFPVTAGVFDDQFDGLEAFVAKMDSTGTNLIFSTFLGGSGNDEARHVSLDSSGNIVVAGFSASSDFPVTPGAFDTSLEGQDDIFIAKMTPNGDGLLFASFLGGSNFDGLNDLALAGDNAIFLCGNTLSADFPTTIGAFDETQNGNSDAFLTKLSADGTSLEFSTFIGTSGFDQSNALAVDGMGQAIIAGSTRDGFPTTAGAFDETHNNGNDAFITKFSAAGDSLVFSTYLGGTGGETVGALLLGPSGNVHVAGDTGNGFPTTVDAVQDTFGGFNDGYISTISADGSMLLYSTYLGGTRVDRVTALGFDADGNLVIAGETESEDFPVTSGAFQTSLYDEQDGFIAVLGCSGTALQFSTYFGGEEDEEVVSMASNGDGVFTLFGETNGPSFPTTIGAFDENFTGTKELFLLEVDLRSESLALLNKTSAVQGIDPVMLEILLPMCAVNPLDVQWFDETNSTSFPLNTNPVTITPMPTASLTMRADVTNTATMNTASQQIRVLVSQNPLYFDFNQDGCNDIADVQAMAPSWMTGIADDPNGDGIIDVRDFLYVNTDGGGVCPLN